MGFVNKQVSNVQKFVENPAKATTNLLNEVKTTATAILSDPKALAVLAINIYLPGAGSAIGTAMGITNATAAAFIGNTVLNTALNGGDVNAAAKAAAFQVGGAELAKTVTAGLSDTAISTATKQIIGNTTSAATIAAIQGKDPMAAIAAGGVMAGVNVITSQYDGFDKLPAASQKAVRTVLTGTLSGAKDAKITSDLVYGAIGSGIQAYKNVSDGNDAAKKELGRDLTDEEANKLALYSSANTVGTDIKNLVVGEKSAKAIESGQSSYTYDNKPVAVSSTDLNNYFKDKLTTAGITPTAADISAASTAYGKSKDAAGATNAVVDSRSVDAQEVKDIFAKEGITNPTADIISKYVKTNFDEATALADIQKQADAQYTTKQEVTDAFKGTGYTPTDADIAKFEGAKPEAMQLDTVRAYTQIVDAFKKEQTDPTKSTEIAKLAFQTVIDPRFMTRLPDGNVLIDTSNAPLIDGLPELPNIQILLDKSDVDQLDYVPEFDETKYDVLQAIQKSNPNIKVDDLITGAMNAMKDQGYVPSIEELINIVNQPKDKTTVNVAKAASDYGDQKAITKDEAKKRLIENGVSKPTDAQINQFVKKGNEADIFKEIDQFANPLATTAAEAEQLLKAAGISKPTKEQIAMFTKEGSQAATETALNTYVNPLVMTAAEAEQALKATGISKPTKEQIAMFTKEGVQKDTELALTNYANPLVTTAAEAEQLLKAAGILKPTKEQIAMFTKEGLQKDTELALNTYTNPIVTTAAEAEQMLKDAGISKPTKEQIAMFTKEGPEAGTKTALNTYVNPLVMTAAEAEQALKDAGISKPTKEQIAMFAKEGLQTDTQTALNTYSNPLVTTAEEVKGMFEKIGYLNPTEEEITRYTGEKPEDVQLDMAKTYGASALATQKYIDPLNKRIEELVKQGNDYKTSSDKAISELTEQNKGLSEVLGTDKKTVTQEDINFMNEMIAGKKTVDSRYDVTGDNRITQEDIDYLQKYISTGTDTGTKPTTEVFKPKAGTYWSPTGLYGKLYEQELARDADKAAADKAAADKLAADKITAAKTAAAQKLVLKKQGTQQSTDAFNQLSAQNRQMVQAIPTLADVHFYGKDFGTKRQKLTPEGELISPKPEEVAQGGVSGENDASSFLQQIMAQGDSASESDLRNIVGGGGYG